MTAVDHAGDAPTAIVPLEIGGVWLALDAAEVREVLGEIPWLPLPNADAHVPGVMPWNGRAVAVVDLGALVGLEARLGGGAGRRRVVIAEHRGHMLGFPVDAVHEVVTLPPGALRPAQVTRPRFASGEVLLEARVVAVVDLGALVAALLTAGGG